MAEKKFSELTSAATLTGSELVAVSQDQSGSLISAKTTTQALSNFTAITAQYSSALQTTNKTICGAINEAAQSGGDTVTVTNTIPATSLTKKVADVNINGTPNAINADDALAVIKDVFGTDHTVEGNPVTFDAWTGIETVKSCSVDLLPIQDLHGYDSPWVGGAGKNKCAPIPYPIPSNGTVITDFGEDKTFTNVSLSFKFSGSFANTQGAYLDLQKDDGTHNYITMGFMRKSDNTIPSANTTYTNEYLTYKYSTTTFRKVVFYNYLTLTDAKFDELQLENSATPTSYVPYSNICPISGRTQASVTRTGKNRFNNTAESITTQGITLTVNADGTITGQNNATGTAIMNVSTVILPNGNYILNGCPSGGGNTYKLDISKDGTYYTDNGSGVSFTVTDQNPYLVRLVVYSGNGNGKVFKPMIRLASIADDTYEPYQGETTEITLPQTVYKGNTNVTDGGTTSAYGIVDLSTLSWSMISNERWSTTLPDAKRPQSNDNPINAVCSNNVVKSISAFVNVSTGNAIGLSSDGFLRCRNGSTTDSPTGQLCYELATPTELTTSAEQISLLKGNNVISTDGDNITLKYSADIGLYIAGQLQS